MQDSSSAGIGSQGEPDGSRDVVSPLKAAKRLWDVSKRSQSVSDRSEGSSDAKNSPRPSAGLSEPVESVAESTPSSGALPPTGAGSFGASQTPSDIDLIMESNWCPPSRGLLGKLSDLTEKKKHREKVAEVLGKEAQFEHRSKSLSECGSYILLREFLTSGSVRLRSANFCNQQRLCVGCAAVKAAKTGAEYFKRTVHLMNSADRRLVPAMITLTIPPGPDVVEQLDTLQRGLSVIRQRRRNEKRGKGAYEWGRPVHCVWHTEIKRAENHRHLWHVHVHGLALLDCKLDLDRLHSEWTEITGASHRPDVRLTSSGREIYRFGKRALSCPGVLAELRADMCEIFKYVMKFNDLSPEDIVHVWKSIRGRRLLQGWDGYYGLKVDDDLRDLSEEDGEWVDWVYRWLSGGYRVQEAYRGEGLAVRDHQAFGQGEDT